MRFLFTRLLIIFLLLGCGGTEDDQSQELDNTPVITSIEVYVSSDEIIVGQQVLFSVFDNTGKNRTTEAKFYVNDSEIDGSSYTFNDIGTFDIYAKFQNLKSNTEQVEVNQVPIEYKQYVLVEDYTGTWCGYCTRVSFAIEELKKQTKDAVVIAIHQGDPMQFSLEATLRSHFGVTGFPTAFVDRKARWAPPEPSSLDQVLSKLTNKAYAALAMESSLDGDILTIKVKLKMGYNYKALKLGLYIVEDELIYDQRNWTSYYQGDPIKNFEHNDVLRKNITGLLGDEIPSEHLGHDKEFEKEFQYVIPSEFNKDNIRMIAFVTEASKKETINVRSSKIGESQSFEK